MLDKEGVDAGADARRAWLIGLGGAGIKSPCVDVAQLVGDHSPTLWIVAGIILVACDEPSVPAASVCSLRASEGSLVPSEK